jgi:hypothetical protein
MHNKMNFLAHWQTKLYTLFDIDSQKKGEGGQLHIPLPVITATTTI